MTGVPAPARWTRLVGDLTHPPEHSRGLRLATLVAVVAAAASIAATGFGDARIWALGLVLIPLGSVVSYLNRNTRTPTVPLLCTLLTLVLVVAFVLTQQDVASPAELRVPLAELLVTLEGIRSFSLRSRREIRFALVSSFALVAVGGALSLSIGFAPFALIWAIGAIAALGMAYRSELRDLADQPSPGSPSVRPPVRRAWPVRPIVTAVAAVLMVAAAVFLLVPAAQSSRLLAFASHLPTARAVPLPGGLSNPSLGSADPARGGEGDGSDAAPSAYLGFSDHLDTSVRGRPGDTLVMRVRAAAPDLWKGQTFDVWDGRTWRLSDQRTALLRGRAAISLLPAAGEQPGRGEEFVQTFYLETPGPNLIFAANRATQVYIPQSALFQLSDGSVRTGVDLDAGSVYTVVSRRPAVTETSLRAAGDAELATPPEILARYTRLPSIPERVRRLAQDVAGDAPTTYDKVLALEAWMAANTAYRLDIPPLAPGADSVDQYLFVDRVGFCEQIGSSLVVMLRSLGVPARLAVGYAPGERNPFTGVYEVRAEDAHAWAEVYFPGIGWQGFDPTAQVPLAGEPRTDAARVGLRSYLARHLPDLPAGVWAAIALLALAAICALWWSPIPKWWTARRRRPAWAELQLARLERIGSARGRPRHDGETAREYAASLRRTVLRDERLDEIGAALGADAFAPHPLPDVERRRVEELIGALSER